MNSVTSLTDQNPLANGDLWSGAGVAALVALAVVFVLAVVRHRPIPGRPAVVLTAVFLAGLAGAIAFSPHPDDAVVTAPDAALALSPIDGAGVERSGEVAVGQTVRVENTHSGFAYVTTSDGKQGWLPQSSLDRFVGTWGGE